MWPQPESSGRLVLTRRLVEDALSVLGTGSLELLDFAERDGHHRAHRSHQHGADRARSANRTGCQRLRQFLAQHLPDGFREMAPVESAVIPPDGDVLRVGTDEPFRESGARLDEADRKGPGAERHERR